MAVLGPLKRKPTPRTKELTMKASISILAAALILFVGLTTWAGSPRSSGSPGTDVESRAYLHSYNLPSAGIALEGYCPVAYFAVNKAVRGKPEYASTHDEVTYYFVSAEAKEAFDRNPDQYLPAYGGWCAFGMSIQDKFPVDPTNFKIVNGRLMVFLKNRNVDARDLWNKGDERDLAAKAGAYWKKVSG